MPALVYPPQLKKKAVYFLKRRLGACITDKLDSEFIIGDLMPNPLEYLATVLEEVLTIDVGLSPAHHQPKELGGVARCRGERCAQAFPSAEWRRLCHFGQG